LLYHGWDESKQQQWANKQTGVSPNFWARAMGWYAMALVDVLDYFPESHPQQKELVRILQRMMEALKKVQDPKTGVWFDLLDKPQLKGNYVEASASAMFVYAAAKGMRKGYLSENNANWVQKGYEGLLKQFIVPGENGGVNLNGTVTVSGLGGSPKYRDGSDAYYLSEKVIQNDAKGVGAFIHAANEMEMRPNLQTGKNKTVMLDHCFNHETKSDLTGTGVSWHYTWNDMSNGGFSLLGDLFEQNGAKLATLGTAPTAEALKAAAVYIIVDPDTQKETSNPNYVQSADVDVIANWVKAGGVLALFSNDSSNAEFTHFNNLAAKFGFRFNPELKNPVINNQYEQGAIPVLPSNPVFKTAKKVYIKELASLKLDNPSYAVLKHKGDNIVAVIPYGKGVVYAVGDPWFYNEYIDGRKLPLEYDNFHAASDFVKWVLANSKH
jgi:unsaturated rhamnogalacturonyl hydrolase